MLRQSESEDITPKAQKTSGDEISLLGKGFQPYSAHICNDLRAGGFRTKCDGETLSERHREINRVEEQSVSQSVIRARAAAASLL